MNERGGDSRQAEYPQITQITQIKWAITETLLLPVLENGNQ